MGLLSFLKKDKEEGDTLQPMPPVNLGGGQPKPQPSGILQGSAPAPIPQSAPQNSAPKGSVGPGNFPQAQSYDSYVPQSGTPVNLDDQFTPIPEQPIDNYSQTDEPIPSYDFNQPMDINNADQALSNSGYTEDVNEEDETLFGNGSLSDIYSTNFPEPSNLEPTAPGMKPIEPIVPAQEPVPTVDTSLPVQETEVEQTTAMGTTNSMQDNGNSAMMMDDLNNDDPFNEIPTVGKSDGFDASSNTPVVNDEPTDTMTTSVADDAKPVMPMTELPKFDLSSLNIPGFGANMDTKPITPSVNNIDSATPDSKESMEPVNLEEEPKKEDVAEVPVAMPVVDMNKTEVEKDMPANIKKVFKKIGILGIDGPGSNSLDKEGIVSMAKALLDDKVELILDSDKGIAMDIVGSATNPKHKITTVSLHPMMSTSITEMIKGKGDGKNFSVVYSNYIEWLHHLAKDSRMFLVFDGAGIENHSLLLTLISISKLYIGNHKPIVLVGESWKAKIDALLKTGVISQSDIEAVQLVNNTESVVSKVEELNKQYSTVQEPHYAKVVDRRVEGDEKEFIVY